MSCKREAETERQRKREREREGKRFGQSARFPNDDNDLSLTWYNYCSSKTMTLALNNPRRLLCH